MLLEIRYPTRFPTTINTIYAASFNRKFRLNNFEITLRLDPFEMTLRLDPFEMTLRLDPSRLPFRDDPSTWPFEITLSRWPFDLTLRLDPSTWPFDLTLRLDPSSWPFDIHIRFWNILTKKIAVIMTAYMQQKNHTISDILLISRQPLYEGFRTYYAEGIIRGVYGAEGAAELGRRGRREGRVFSVAESSYPNRRRSSSLLFKEEQTLDLFY
jgi:hypothetical protein